MPGPVLPPTGPDRPPVITFPLPNTIPGPPGPPGPGIPPFPPAPRHVNLGGVASSKRLAGSAWQHARLGERGRDSASLDKLVRDLTGLKRLSEPKVPTPAPPPPPHDWSFDSGDWFEGDSEDDALPEEREVLLHSQREEDEEPPPPPPEKKHVLKSKRIMFPVPPKFDRFVSGSSDPARRRTFGNNHEKEKRGPPLYAHWDIDALMDDVVL